jgi:uncharacterized protein (DUF433 family)
LREKCFIFVNNFFNKMEDWIKYIEINPAIRSGKPIIKGSRITVGDILRKLALGLTIEELIIDFPLLNRDNILAALAFSSHKEEAVHYLMAI